MHFIIEYYTGRNAKRPIRQRFEKDEIIIGRSYACDLIIDDPYVSSQHIRIYERDGIFIEDLDSKNSTRYKKKKIRNQNFVIESGDEVFIGHTKVKIYSSDHAIHPTKKINWANDAREFLTHPLAMFFVFLISYGVNLLSGLVFFTGTNFFEEKVYKASLGIVITIGVASVLLLFSSLLSKHTMRIATSISYASIFCIVINIFYFLIMVSFAPSLSFYFSLGAALAILTLVTIALILLIAYLENGKISLKDWITTGLILVVVPFIGFYDYIFPSEFIKLAPQYESSVPVFGWKPVEAYSIDRFLEFSEDIFHKTKKD